MTKLKGLFTIKWLLFSILCISLAFNVKSDDVGSIEYAYFRADHYLGCSFTTSHRHLSEKYVGEVLKQVGNGSPYINILTEPYIPDVLNFFDENGWEIVSHSCTTSGGSNDVVNVRFTCVLKKK